MIPTLRRHADLTRAAQTHGCSARAKQVDTVKEVLEGQPSGFVMVARQVNGQQFLTLHSTVNAMDFVHKVNGQQRRIFIDESILERLTHCFFFLNSTRSLLTNKRIKFRGSMSPMPRRKIKCRYRQQRLLKLPTWSSSLHFKPT